jgi:hypothetical protein
MCGPHSFPDPTIIYSQIVGAAAAGEYQRFDGGQSDMSALEGRLKIYTLSSHTSV